jgi:hypothetical protein
MTDREAVKRKIRSAFAMADPERNPNAGERDNAKNIAEKLMREHKISKDEVEGKQKSKTGDSNPNRYYDFRYARNYAPWKGAQGVGGSFDAEKLKATLDEFSRAYRENLRRGYQKEYETVSYAVDDVVVRKECQRFNETQPFNRGIVRDIEGGGILVQWVGGALYHSPGDLRLVQRLGNDPYSLPPKDRGKQQRYNFKVEK